MTIKKSIRTLFAYLYFQNQIKMFISMVQLKRFQSKLTISIDEDN